MSFNEAAELAYFGAKVLHPATLLPAMEASIPVQVLNSMNREDSGTTIRKIDEENDCVVKSIAYKENLTVITVISTRMLMASGFMASIFNVFDRYETPVDTVTTSEVSVSITVDSVVHLDGIIQELQTFARVEVERNKAIVCLVGEAMKRTPGMVGRIFGLLDEFPIHMISQGASEINISFVIDNCNIQPVVERLHHRFFEESFDSSLFIDATSTVAATS
jgi:aspartate kinase